MKRLISRLESQGVVNEDKAGVSKEAFRAVDKARVEISKYIVKMSDANDGFQRLWEPLDDYKRESKEIKKVAEDLRNAMIALRKAEDAMDKVQVDLDDLSADLAW